MVDAHHFNRPFTLRDGTPVVMRAVRADDADRLLHAFGELNAQTRYLRFFSAKSALADDELARLTHPDFVNTAVLVVTLGSDAGEIIIGGASMHAHDAPDGARHAEVSFTIEEDYHGQGIAGRLLDALAEIARAWGVAVLEAEVLAANGAMLAVFRRSGLPMRTHLEDGVVLVELALPRG